MRSNLKGNKQFPNTASGQLQKKELRIKNTDNVTSNCTSIKSNITVAKINNYRGKLKGLKNLIKFKGQK